MDSPADIMGIKKGDILFKINDNPVETKVDVSKNLMGSRNKGTVRKI